MKTISFVKMHGLGNDFILVDNRSGRLRLRPADARFLCRRSFGVGADGVIVAERTRRADLRMAILNSDGSRAEMCGNGIRCLALWARRHGLVRANRLSVETDAGVKAIRILGDTATVDMGEPCFEGRKIPVRRDGEILDHPRQFGPNRFRITCVSMGNPHCVIFADPASAPLGERIETDPFFPKRTNVEFVRVRSRFEIEVGVWERGAGITLACGTGACASAVASARLGKTGRRVKVRLPGGTLRVEWAADNHVYMTGPAEFVFTGEVPLPVR
jgi:diaminopimelate epimerase